MGTSFDLSYTVLRNFGYHLKITVCPSVLLSPRLLDLENFTTARRSSLRIVGLASMA